jgi:ribonuclease E
MDKNKMLIDATHPEETRVVALRNGRVEEFDFESAARKLLRGNIYLAKVTRVEPSLQAAFIDYGGNRHGFLAFNEIHPDYYQIPVADREALKQEEAEAEQMAEAEADERARSRGPKRRRRERGDRGKGDGRGNGHGRRDEETVSAVDTFEDGYQTSIADPGDAGADHEADSEPTAQPLRHMHGDDVLRGSDSGEPAEAYTPPVEFPYPDEDRGHAVAEHPEDVAQAIETARVAPSEIDADDDVDDDTAGGANPDDDLVEQVATEEDALEEVPERPRRRARQYKIQEVIKRRQIMLVQVVKEERGNKGAALTTYISLAGRYTVLMPNTARGGGISRKITQPQDRKRLKAIAEELDVPEGMGLIIRTAGAARTKQEIKRDYEYLLRLWESVRDLTLSSTAPSLVYEEGNIIKRAIRDLYSKEFDQIVVAGQHAHREAQDFMEMLMPGSGGHVASYNAAEPLFARYGIERQLNALFSPHVTLRSGGYIVINQTEALVAIDVNSGKSTREFSIEETALNTNLEASEEIARQLKLRDLAGLIVVDFIDMEEKRNNRAVERRLKDALRHDRARIQVGRISHFGLLEMSRQRLRAGVLEGSTSQCPHCQGTGIIRSIESVALAVLRGIEDQLLKQPGSLVAQTTAEVALYILNHKRAFIAEVERRDGVSIRVEANDRMQGANFAIERIAAPLSPAKPAARAAVSMEWGFDRDEDTADVEEIVETSDVDGDDAPTRDGTERREGEGGGGDDRRGRRRRRRRGRRDRDGETRPQLAASDDAGEHDDADGHSHHEHDAGASAHADDGSDDDMIAISDSDGDGTDGGRDAGDGPQGEGGEPRKRGRRRGRRGGRSRRRDGQPMEAGTASDWSGDAQPWNVAESAGDGHDGTAYQGAGGGMPRPGIVETADGGAHLQRGTLAWSSMEASRLAVALASPAPKPRPVPVRVAVEVAAAPVEAVQAAAPPMAEIPAPVRIQAPIPAPIRVRVPIVTAPVPPTPDAPPATNGHAASTPAEIAPPEPAKSEDLRAAAEPVDDPSRPAKRGWWQRRFGGPA